MYKHQTITQCRICGNPNLTEILSLGNQYLASAFVRDNKSHDLATTTFPLTLMLCDSTNKPQACGLVQLKETVDRDLMYREYFYRSATNPMMRETLREIAAETLARTLVKPGDAILDIGCNDGTMLSYFPSEMVRVGMDPARNIRLDGLDPSVHIECDYFNAKAAMRLSGGKKFKIVTSIAMFYDLDNPHTFVKDVKDVLDAEGIWCIQLSYLKDIIRNLNFFDICHEHLLYYSLHSLTKLFAMHGMRIIDASTNSVNGGSLRIFIAHTGSSHSVNPSVQAILDEEASDGLNDKKTYLKFEQSINELKDKILEVIKKENKAGRPVTALGASTKGNVLLQNFGITAELIPYISDRNHEKHGLRTLGTDIEIISEEALHKLNPAVQLVLIWFFKDEIIRREAEYLKNGGKLLFPMPYPYLVTKDGEERL